MDGIIKKMLIEKNRKLTEYEKVELKISKFDTFEALYDYCMNRYRS